MPSYNITYVNHIRRTIVVDADNPSNAIKAADEKLRLNEENGSETESDWQLDDFSLTHDTSTANAGVTNA